MTWNYLNYEVLTKTGDVIQVILTGSAANVLLLDDANFVNYQRGKPFRYYGGYYQHSPVVLSPPSPGKWHVVIDTGGRPGHLNAAVRVIHSSG
ncbi:MAG TPA: DUF1883 domain-containing protein [Candidatus Sulfotelmatobacter sp.]|nr:DUF1883 domain-containing protein [Candidatus Sulfotelmatobacter sp.]